MGYDLDYHWDITDGGLPGEDFQTSNATKDLEINFLGMYYQPIVRQQAKPDQSA